MRILIAGTTGESMPPPYGGVPKVSLLYAREWIQRLHEQVGIAFVYRPENADDLGARADYFFEFDSKPNKIKKIRFLLSHAFAHPLLYLRIIRAYFKVHPVFAKDIFLFAAYGIWIDQLLARYKPDVLLLESAIIKGVVAAFVAKWRNIPIVIDSYAEIGDERMGVNAYLSPDQRKTYWTNILGMSEFVLGISNCSIGALRYLPKEKVKVFYDTCDFSLCHAEVLLTRAQIREQFQLAENRFLVGAVGAFEYRKGHHHLIQAAALAIKQGLDMGIVICGGSGDPEKWRALAAEHGIQDRLAIFEKLSEQDLAKILRCLDVYANLSNTPRSCGLDLALLEGMASSIPVIVYRNGGLPEAVPEGKNGWIVNTDDIPGVARAMVEAYALPPEKRQEMGKESSRIASKYDIRLTSVIKRDWLREAVSSYADRRNSA